MNLPVTVTDVQCIMQNLIPIGHTHNPVLTRYLLVWTDSHSLTQYLMKSNNSHMSHSQAYDLLGLKWPMKTCTILLVSREKFRWQFTLHLRSLRTQSDYVFMFRSWYEACCDAWSAFVRRVDGIYLGPLLSQISVTLLPLLDILPSQVSNSEGFWCLLVVSDYLRVDEIRYVLPFDIVTWNQDNMNFRLLASWRIWLLRDTRTPENICMSCIFSQRISS